MSKGKLFELEFKCCFNTGELHITARGLIFIMCNGEKQPYRKLQQLAKAEVGSSLVRQLE
jgi:hypothetical protein